MKIKCPNCPQTTEVDLTGGKRVVQSLNEDARLWFNMHCVACGHDYELADDPRNPVTRDRQKPGPT